MDFICGEHFKSLCDFSLDENGFNKIHQEKPQFKEPLFFVKTDYIFHFVNNFLKEPVRLLTHNSDYCIDQKYISVKLSVSLRSLLLDELSGLSQLVLVYNLICTRRFLILL